MTLKLNELSIWFIFSLLLLAVTVQQHVVHYNESHVHETPLIKAFLDPSPIMTSILCSIFVSSTTALELILDIIFNSELSKVHDKTERFMLFFVVVVPGFFILKAAHTPEIASVFCSWHMFHFMGSLAPVYSICCRYIPDHFGGIQLPLSYFFWVCSGVISLWGIGGPLGTCRVILIAGLGVLSQAIFLCALYRWVKSLHTRIRDANSQSAKSLTLNLMSFMHEDEFCCALYVLFGLVILIVGFASLAASLNLMWSNSTQAEILVGVYIFIIFTILTSCIPGRAKQYASSLQKQKLDAGRATVRYISHEIRSPLNIVQNGIKLLIRELQGNCSKNVFDNLLDVQHASDAATVIVDDLLDFEKIQSGKFTLNQKYVPVSTCLSKIAESCRALAGLKGVHFFVNDYTSQHHDLIHTAYVDVLKLEQVIRNLIMNSIKFTQAGGSISINLSHSIDFPPVNEERNTSTLKIFQILYAVQKLVDCFYHWFVGLGTKRVRVYSAPQNQANTTCQPPSMPGPSEDLQPENYYTNGCIIIEVADTGIGMSSEQTANVFGEFVQFDPNRLQGGGGSGLGLWICKEIIKAHGGSISVHSDGLGNGTKVSLKINCYTKKFSNEEFGISPSASSLYHTRSAPKLQCEDSKFASALLYDIDSRTHGFSSAISQIEEEKSTRQTTTLTIQRIMNPTRKLCFLIVDDSALNRKILIKTIKSLQDSWPNVLISFTEADDGALALQLMGSACIEFDAVFMDNIMPNMNGPQAAEAMRNKHNFKGRIIGVTGNGLDSDILDFKMHGADRVLIKPVCWEVLKSELEVLMGSPAG